MFYLSQDKVMSLGKYSGGAVLVQYYAFRGMEGFEVEVADLKSALETADMLRRYDSYHDFHRRKRSYSPFAEFLQRGDDGEWVSFGQAALPGEPPWVKPK